MKTGLVFHTLSYISYESWSLAKFVTAAENLAANEAIDEGKVLVKVFKVQGTEVRLPIKAESKEFFSTIITC